MRLDACYGNVNSTPREKGEIQIYEQKYEVPIAVVKHFKYEFH